ncbi:MAG: hypothetical protein IJT94_13580 [Oscillibacter sp.]|nr:hypothetical protein [Oscillibacter sp.]
MIRTLEAAGSAGALEIAGTPYQIAKEAAMMVQVIYNSLHMQDTAAGAIFRQTFSAEFEKGTLWQIAQTQDPPRRSGPVIPTQ